VPAGPVDHVDEVADPSVVEDAIPKVAADTCREEAQSNLNDALPTGPEKKHAENNEHRQNGDTNEKRSLSAGDSKGSAFVQSQLE